MTDTSAIRGRLKAVGSDLSKRSRRGLFGTLTDLTVNCFWLGSLPSASGLAVVGGIASSSLYFVHELVWSRFEQTPEQANARPGMGYETPPPVPVRPGHALR